MDGEVVVTGAGLERTVEIDGARYVLRAPSFGDLGAMLAAQGAPAPSAALIRDAMREYLLTEDREDMAAALAAVEDAEDALAVYWAGQPPALDAEGVAHWRSETAPERAQLEAEMTRAIRRAMRAEAVAEGSSRVQELRRRQQTAQIDAARSHVALCLALVPPGDRVADDVVDALPAPHVLALSVVAQALMRPGAEARKN